MFAEEIERFLNETLAPLQQESDPNNELEHTLYVYIESNKSAAETAAKLHIHINTLYKRLKKIEKLLQMNFNCPEDNLKIQLACHLKKSLDSSLLA
ncbi:hypothetical protein F9802_03320 [Bacillus aerolatus]|uniref:PucR C-terminal helix-turn-helix domain-containing protein n=1 Tax=Bacillus aerolatus TaxID=2653354 RepID=A0A6I1FKP6_9BACI|nr:hypothetical protein F9802_03320 [Bacillus aerolatus]